MSQSQYPELDSILTAYERGVGMGQKYKSTNIPYPRESPEAYAFIRGMAYGMTETTDSIVFDGAIQPKQKAVKVGNFHG